MPAGPAAPTPTATAAQTATAVDDGSPWADVQTSAGPDAIRAAEAAEIHIRIAECARPRAWYGKCFRLVHKLSVKYSQGSPEVKR